MSALGAAIGKGVSDAATSVSNAAGGLVASASRAAESVPALERAATDVATPFTRALNAFTHELFTAMMIVVKRSASVQIFNA